MSYQRITDPGHNTGKVVIGSNRPIKPRQLNDDEILIQKHLLAGPRRPSIVQRLANFVLSLTR